MEATQEYLSLVTTDDVSDPVPVIKELLKTNRGIAFVRFQWIDYAGVLRVKVLVVETCLALLAEGKFVHVPPMALHCAADSTLLTGTNYPGINWLVPDWSSLRLGFDPSSLRVMCGVFARSTLSSPSLDWWIFVLVKLWLEW